MQEIYILSMHVWCRGELRETATLRVFRKLDDALLVLGRLTHRTFTPDDMRHGYLSASLTSDLAMDGTVFEIEESVLE